MYELPANYTTLAPFERRLVREQYIELQQGNCWYCNQPLAGPPPPNILAKPLNLKLFPTGFLDHPIHLQHDHNTGLTEGAVHAYCNGVLWQYEHR